MFKKLAFLLLITSIISCSSDDSPETSTTIIPEPESPILISKITETFNGQVNAIFDFNYEDGKLKNVDLGAYKIVFTYENNKIIRLDYIDDSVLPKFTTIDYEGDKLKSLILSDNVRKTEFTYDGEILKEKTKYFNQENSWNVEQKNSFTYLNQNITEERQGNLKYTYSYDDKNHPMRDMNPYLRFLLPISGFYLLNENNATEHKLYSRAENTTPFLTYRYEIIYNENNFPIKISRYHNNQDYANVVTTIDYL